MRARAVQVLHTSDAQAQFYPSVDYDHGACGTQVFVNGTLYGPSDVPGGNDPTDFVPVDQSEVTGTGFENDPFQIVTVVTGGPLQLTQTDTYDERDSFYRTTIAVKNTDSVSRSSAARATTR